jgi:hypothetical protein
MTQEERVMRAREVLNSTRAKRSCDAPVGNVVSIGCAIDAMLAFADEGSGIGELRERHPTRFHFTDDAPLPVETIEGTILLGKGWLAITEEEYRELNAPPDIDRSGLAQEVERCEYCGDTGDAHRTDGEWLGECTCGRAMPQSS